MTAFESIPRVSAPLPWQAQVWASFNQQIDKQQLPHAMLLAGPEYSGKGHLALALARLLLCHKPREGLNCGDCHACELTASGNHGDLRWLQPEPKSRVIKIDQVRQVVEFANKTASLGLRKVVVLLPADSMNLNAANALLKSLEEPAANTHLILVCQRVHGLPATIRSRCQLVRLPLPGSTESLAWLERLTGDRRESEKLLQLADGRALLAEQIYREDTVEHVARVRRVLQDLLTGTAGVAETAILLSEENVEKMLAQTVAQLHTILRGLNGPQLSSRQGVAAFALMDALLRAQQAVNAGANPNRQLMIEALLAKYQRELGGAGLGDKIDGAMGGVQL